MSEDKFSEILRYLEVIERSVSLIRDSLVESCVCKSIPEYVSTWECPVHGEISKNGKPKEQIKKEIRIDPPLKTFVPSTVLPTQLEVAKPVEVVDKSHIRYDRIDKLLHMDNYPEAVSPHLIARENSPSDQIKRANACLDMIIDCPTDGIAFLDFGCGEGWMAKQILDKGVAKSVGYDIDGKENWKTIQNVFFTTKLEEVTDQTYDMIFLYDVLDHMLGNPKETMDLLYDLLNPSGVIYVRCHPYTSRHAAHLHQNGLNKAYLHLFLNKDELDEIVGKPTMFVRPETNPQEAYRWWFDKFKVCNSPGRMCEKPVDPFFEQPYFREMLQEQFPDRKIKDIMNDLAIDFIDFVLTK